MLIQEPVLGKSHSLALLLLLNVLLSTWFLLTHHPLLLLQDTYQHHWREGNMSSGARCEICRRTCSSSDILAGMRCEWCGITVSVFFLKYIYIFFLNPPNPYLPYHSTLSVCLLSAGFIRQTASLFSYSWAFRLPCLTINQFII